ncbi:P-loop containing nucleoside triphosphate hydrolase protein [Lactifluus subvellereus]|nr:P-loop containing nucleoside triphosphate hydrolase protein [Lactifluus subvellereus]
MESLFLSTSVVRPLTLRLLPVNSNIETTTAPNDAFMNATEEATASTPSKLLMPTRTDFSSMITSISSFSALRDYAKFIVLGGAFETLRRLYSASYSSLVGRFFVRATFESEDEPYRWMMFWLSSLPQWRQFRDYSVSTSRLGLGDAALEFDENENEERRRRTRPLRFLPSYTSSYRMWYKGRYIKISRIKDDKVWPPNMSTLIITIFSLDRSILDSLILEARQKWMAARKDRIQVFVSENDWKLVASRAKRPLNSIVLDDGIKELLLRDAREFMRSKQWYTDRGIPFRRGYLLYGAPGSGKTSIIHILAGELDLDIYILSLSRTGLDDSTLNSLMSSLPEHCIAVMEDIDAAFTHGVARDTTGTDLEDPRLSQRGRDDPEAGRRDGQGQAPSQIPGEPAGSKASRITLSGLLNALDGISAQEGRLLFATTNRYQTLDPALTRPGRMDLHIEFRLASRYQARELYKHFYAPDPPKSAVNGEGDDASTLPGYVTPLKEDSGPTQLNGIGTNELPKYSGIAQSERMPDLSTAVMEQLAEDFSARIPERELSMASLQEYLMTYKVRPFQAVDDVERWVTETRERKDRKAEAGAARAKE